MPVCVRRSGGAVRVAVLLSQFDGLLAGQMFYFHTEHQHAVETFLYFLLQRLIMMGVVAVAQQSGSGEFLISVIDDADMSESDDAAEEGGVALAVHIVLVDDAEGSLVVPPDGVHLMSFDSTMEVEATLVVDETDRHCIRIIIVAQQSECARGGTLKDADALFV